MIKLFRYIILSAFIVSAFGLARAQEIPIFSQKLTDAFIYNPSFAGQEYGSVTYAHSSAFNKVARSGQINYLSANMPLVYNHFGVGVNVYNENINFINNTYASGAFAYHLQIGRDQLLSMGVAAEYNNLRPDLDKVVGDTSDEMLAMLEAGDYNQVDFSAGLSYRHRYFKVGIASNRLATAFKADVRSNILSQYYTVQGKLMLPLRADKDLLEPMLTYRKFSKISHIWDLGLYYTYQDLVLLGVSGRIGSSAALASVENAGIDIINLTTGFRMLNKLLIGYSLDITSTSNLGPSHQLTLRYDFIEVDRTNRLNGRSPMLYRGRMKRTRKR